LQLYRRDRLRCLGAPRCRERRGGVSPAGRVSGATAWTLTPTCRAVLVPGTRTTRSVLPLET